MYILFLEPCEERFDPRHKVLNAKRLRHNVVEPTGAIAVYLRISRISGDCDNGNVAVDVAVPLELPDLMSAIHAVEYRHFDVCKKDWPLASPCAGRRLPRPISLDKP